MSSTVRDYLKIKKYFLKTVEQRGNVSRNSKKKERKPTNHCIQNSNQSFSKPFASSLYHCFLYFRISTLSFFEKHGSSFDTSPITQKYLLSLSKGKRYSLFSWWSYIAWQCHITLAGSSQTVVLSF